MHKLELPHDHPRWAALRAGTRCVCCNADAAGHRAPYNTTADGVFSAPVCRPCSGHALAGSAERVLQLVLVFVAASVLLLGYLDSGAIERDAAIMGWTMIGAAAVWRATTWQLLRQARARGHHPGMEFQIGEGCTTIATSNPRLVDELMALHPTAVVRHAEPIAEARAVKISR